MAVAPPIKANATAHMMLPLLFDEGGMRDTATPITARIMGPNVAHIWIGVIHDMPTSLTPRTRSRNGSQGAASKP